MSLQIDPDLATSAMPDSRPAPRGMPHRCLRIPEIQMQIFSLLPRTACDSLAQTCTAFYEQAMDIVWAEVTTFTPLVQCIRSETLMIEENNDPKRSVYRKMRTLSFSRDPSPEDWRQFTKHAHRVKVFDEKKYLTMSRSEYAYRLAPKAITTISRFLDDEAVRDVDYHLFPRLRTLRVDGVVSDCRVPKYLPYLSRGTLRSLELDDGFGCPTVDGVHVSWSAVVPLMRSAWPCLRSIKLDLRNSDDDSQGPTLGPCSQFLGPWLESLAYLKTLKASVVLHPSLLPALSKLPLLRRLDLDLCRLYPDKHHHTAIDTKLLPLLHPCFSSLTTARIVGDASTLESIILLHQSLENSAKLKDISLYLSGIPDTPHSATQLVALFEAISHIPSIKILSIRIHKERGGSILVLSGASFSALFSLHKIHILHLQGDFDITIEDKDLFSAAAAWPQLMELELPSFDHPMQSRITLVGIQTLYEGCPFLRQAYMNMSCSLPMFDHSVQSALLNLPLIHANDDGVSRRVPVRILNLAFTLLDPETGLSYDDTDSARCMAMAIRVMLPMVNCFASNYRDDCFWTHCLVESWNKYRRYVPKEAEVSALWKRVLKRKSGAGEDDVSESDD